MWLRPILQPAAAVAPGFPCRHGPGLSLRYLQGSDVVRNCRSKRTPIWPGEYAHERQPDAQSRVWPYYFPLARVSPITRGFGLNLFRLAAVQDLVLADSRGPTLGGRAWCMGASRQEPREANPGRTTNEPGPESPGYHPWMVSWQTPRFAGRPMALELGVPPRVLNPTITTRKTDRDAASGIAHDSGEVNPPTEPNA